MSWFAEVINKIDEALGRLTKAKNGEDTNYQY